MQQLTHATSTTAPTSGWGSNPLAGYQFTYDAESRITAINSYVDGATDYAYDHNYGPPYGFTKIGLAVYEAAGRKASTILAGRCRRSVDNAVHGRSWAICNCENPGLD